MLRDTHGGNRNGASARGLSPEVERALGDDSGNVTCQSLNRSHFSMAADNLICACPDTQKSRWSKRASSRKSMILLQPFDKRCRNRSIHRRSMRSPADVRGRKSACILICDITRPVPNRLFLRPMVETLVASGIPLSRITILVATGLHRPNLGEELAQLVGDLWVMEKVRIENHYTRNEAHHVDLGLTATRGTPVKLDRRFVEADLRIATGLVEPHFMAGWSGIRKVVAPGVAHHETIRTFHSARFMEDPLAVQCNLIGNPLHEEQLEIVRGLGDVYALNTVIDDKRALAYVNFGEIIASHAAAVQFVGAAIRVPAPRKFKTVITSSAGYPLDMTYYQTIKGMVTPMDILAPGGTLIIASE